MTGQNIVITGEGIVSTIGCDKDSVRESIKSLRTGIGEMKYLQSRVRDLPVGEVKMSNDEMKGILDIPADKEISRTTLMGIIAVKQAIEQARLPKEKNLRIVLISGTTVAGMDITEQKFGKMAEKAEELVKQNALDNPNGQPKQDSDWLEHHNCGSCTEDIASYFGLFTEFTTISTACSSAANALILGADMLKAGDADIVVAGGTEALSQFHLNGFNSLMILDHEVCRPFDNNRHGLNLGEGAAFVVLEREAEARKRSAQIDAYVLGYGNACDAFHQTASSPEAPGAQMAMRKALDMAELQPQALQWIHAHGTGTPDNDKSEGVAIKSVFGDNLPMVSSTEGFTGHTTSASGSISAVISIIAMHDGFVPANLGFSEPIDGGVIPVYENTTAELHHIMVNSFGFGGNDSSLILSDKGLATGNKDFAHKPKIEAVELVQNFDMENLSELKYYVKPMEMRRMGKLMKNGLLTSLRVLEDSEVEMPDAIITGTAWGSLEYSEKLLQQLSAGDDVFKPTYFMQSTHNTISSLIAIHLKCHGYNITFSQGEDSLDWAIYQAKLLIRSGRYKTVLVGRHDESTPLFNELLKMTGHKQVAPLHSVAIVLREKN